MKNEEILGKINLLKERVKEIIQSIQSLKAQLQQARISHEEFRLNKAGLEEELRSILKRIAVLKDSIQFEVTIQKRVEPITQETTNEIKVSKESEKLLFYFQTEFEEFVNKASVYLSGSIDDKYIELGFIELFYPPVAQRDKPFNVACVAVQRGAIVMNLDFNIALLSELDFKKERFEEGTTLELRAQKPNIIKFKIEAKGTHRYSFRAIIKDVEEKIIDEFADVYYDFDVKVLPFIEIGNINDFFETKTGRYLIYSYLACEREEAELFNELQDHLSELGVNSFDPLMKIVPGAKNAQELLDVGREIQETIIFVIDNYKLIKQYQNFEKIDNIENKLVQITETLFMFKSEGIVLAALEGLENSLQLSMIFRLFFKICKLGLRKLLILKTMIGIGKDYGYNISNYFTYIKRTPI